MQGDYLSVSLSIYQPTFSSIQYYVMKKFKGTKSCPLFCRYSNFLIFNLCRCMETNQRQPQPHPNLDAVAVKQKNPVHKVHIFYLLFFMCYCCSSELRHCFCLQCVLSLVFFSQNKHCMLSSVVQTNAWRLTLLRSEWAVLRAWTDRAGARTHAAAQGQCEG